MRKTYKLTLTAMFVAIGTVTSSLVFIPIGIVKAFPIQHILNVMSAVILGPFYAVLQAFTISLLRNLMGTGTLFAFPGSMIGALLASLLFIKTKKVYLAAGGEVVGTGLIGAVFCYPIATLFLGKEATLFGFIPSFIVSSFVGGVIGIIVLRVLMMNKGLERSIQKSF
ncbi:hypothetical protein GCM10008967_05440 [Bacillus carboniphilus]|uniref:Energy coupling factor transporter S component ThiW n=1 Tax=Bacillus carboniphilus TaxID=86663 RepID=A0ABN0VUN1_9BACI